MATEASPMAHTDLRSIDETSNSFRRNTRGCFCFPCFVAGPKWKTFIRRFNRSRSNNGSDSYHHHGKFQYDALSYSLNFEEDANLEDDFSRFRNFSSRYASRKWTSTDVGGVDVRGKDVAVVE